MSNAILATFSADNVRRLGESRFRQLMEAITPALNVWAGEAVYWASLDDGGFLLLGSAPPEPAMKELSRVQYRDAVGNSVEGVVVAIKDGLAWVSWDDGPRLAHPHDLINVRLLRPAPSSQADQGAA